MFRALAVSKIGVVMPKRGADEDESSSKANIEDKAASPLVRPSGKSAVQLCPATAASLSEDPGEALHGTWKSDKGECVIGKDPVTARLSYTEPLPEGQRIHGWLDIVPGEARLWQGRLALLEANQGPWYGPSFGPAPEILGDIRVHLTTGKPSAIETQIRDDEKADWSERTLFTLKEGAAAATMEKPNLDKILPMTQSGPGDEEEEEKEQGEQKKVRRDE